MHLVKKIYTHLNMILGYLWPYYITKAETEKVRQQIWDFDFRIIEITDLGLFSKFFR